MGGYTVRSVPIPAHRLRFPFAVVLDIADVMDIDPIEIIAGLEYRRCRERDRERVKGAYFKAHCAHFVYPNNPGFFHRKKRFFG